MAEHSQSRPRLGSSPPPQTQQVAKQAVEEALASAQKARGIAVVSTRSRV